LSVELEAAAGQMRREHEQWQPGIVGMVGLVPTADAIADAIAIHSAD
jgi:hypothetical protein